MGAICRRAVIGWDCQGRREREQEMALDDRLGDVDELPAVGLRVVAEHLERLVGGKRMPGHQDALRLLDRRSPAEGALKVLVLGEALQRDVDRVADPAGLTQGYATLARRAGAELSLGEDVLGVIVDRDRVAGVRTMRDEVRAPVVVNAAGPWAAALASSAGVDLPLDAIQAPNVVTTGPFPGVPERRTLVIDAGTSFYLHREADGVLMGMGSPDERASFDLTPDEAFIADQIVPTAVRVFPPIEAAGLRSTWAGLYEMTPDRHPIIGASPVEGLLLANGFSGHGFQHAPVIGKLLAELVMEGVATQQEHMVVAQPVHDPPDVEHRAVGPLVVAVRRRVQDRGGFGRDAQSGAQPAPLVLVAAGGHQAIVAGISDLQYLVPARERPLPHLGRQRVGRDEEVPAVDRAMRASKSISFAPTGYSIWSRPIFFSGVPCWVIMSTCPGRFTYSSGKLTLLTKYFARASAR